MFLNFLHVLNDGFLVSMPLLLPFIKNELELNLSQVGFLGSVLNALGIVLALPAGYIATRYGNMRSLTWAVCLYGLGFLFTSIAPNFWFLVVAFLIAGTGFGVFHPVAFATIAKTTEKSRLGRAMGNFTAIGDVGRVVISAGITFIAVAIGWRQTSVVYGLMALIIFISILLTKHRDIKNTDSKKSATISFAYLLKHKQFMGVSLIGAFDSFASSSLFVFIPFLLLSKGINPAVLGAYTGLFFIGNFIGKSMLGRFVDKFGNTKVLVVAEAMMVLIYSYSQ